MAETSQSTSTGSSGAGSLHRIPPLRGADNYNMWRTQMEDILTDLDLYGHVTGQITAPAQTIEVTIKGAPDGDGKQSTTTPTTETQTNAKYTEWVKSDRKALSNIRLRVEGNVLTHIQACKTSADAWDLLAATFQVKGTVGLIDLRRKFFSHRMPDGEDIEELSSPTTEI